MKFKILILSIILVIILPVILIVILIVIPMFISNSQLLMINWNIKLPNPSEVDVIYNFDYREGDDFEIWKYDKSEIEKVKYKFTLIGKENKEIVKDYFIKHYKDLSYNDERKNKFEENFSIDDMVIEGNYYILIKDNENKTTGSYLLLLLNVENNSIYYFNHIR